jgi:hypothetical protein
MDGSSRMMPWSKIRSYQRAAIGVMDAGRRGGSVPFRGERPDERPWNSSVAPAPLADPDRVDLDRKMRPFPCSSRLRAQRPSAQSDRRKGIPPTRKCLFINRLAPTRVERPVQYTEKYAGLSRPFERAARAPSSYLQRCYGRVRRWSLASFAVTFDARREPPIRKRCGDS